MFNFFKPRKINISSIPFGNYMVEVSDGVLVVTDSNGTTIDCQHSNEWVDNTNRVELRGESLFVFDSNNNEIHRKDSDGFERWKGYNRQGNELYCNTNQGWSSMTQYDCHGVKAHYSDTNGNDVWYAKNGNHITAKIYNHLYSSSGHS